MKKIILYILLLATFMGNADAQTKKVKSATAKKVTGATQPPPQASEVNRSASLLNWGHYNAKKAQGRTLFISDPTVNTLNRRANGENLPADAKDILGVPKITYGLGNGQIFFRSRGATTSGTGTGSGTVGTGSSPGPLGISGLALGVNGKSPYAGPIMDGIIISGLPAGTEQETPRRKIKSGRQ